MKSQGWHALQIRTRPIIIAEIGINHNGHMDLANILIQKAKEAGADIAKFQLYDPKKLLHPINFSPEDWVEILNSQLTFEETKQLFQVCENCNIEFMASAFDLERLEWLEEIGVKRHKIASRSAIIPEYVEAIKATGKEYFVGTGYLDKIENTLGEYNAKKYCLYPFPSKVKFLYCISEYPAPLKKFSLAVEYGNSYWINITKLQQVNYYGYSDHTIGTSAVLYALSKGALAIEKHVTLDKTMDGPDHKCSADCFELKRICDFRDDLMRMAGQ